MNNNIDVELKETVIKIVNKIKELPLNTETSITQLLQLDQVGMIDPLTQGIVYNKVKEKCENNNITIERTDNSFGGLAYNYKFKKIIMNNNGLIEYYKENEQFIRDLKEKDMFMFDLSCGRILPKNHPNYYDGRLDVSIRKIRDKIYGHIEFEKEEYKLTEELANNLYNYIENNIDRFIRITLNQNSVRDIASGGYNNICIKYKSIYLDIDMDSIENYDDQSFVYELNKMFLNLNNNRVNKQVNNDKFVYNEPGEFLIFDSICELCKNYNNGLRNEKCPKELIEKIIHGEVDCPNYEKIILPSILDDYQD